MAWSSRDRGDLRQSNGETAPNDESINNMLAKGTWQIDSAQSLSGLVRYYNNDAREPKIRRLLRLLIAATRWLIVQQFNAMRSFSYKLAPQSGDWLNADAKIYWSEVRINAQNTGSSGEYREQITKGTRLENRSTLFADSFASHLLTYGGEYYRQEQHPGGATTGFPQAKSILAPAGYRMRSPYAICRLPCLAEPAMTVIAVAATATKMLMPTNGHLARG